MSPVHGEVYSIQQYVIVFQWLATGQVFSLIAPVSRYNYNIVKSGVKHHKPNQSKMYNIESDRESAKDLLQKSLVIDWQGRTRDANHKQRKRGVSWKKNGRGMSDGS
jgi:hypothetical protein